MFLVAVKVATTLLYVALVVFTGLAVNYVVGAIDWSNPIYWAALALAFLLLLLGALQLVLMWQTKDPGND